MSGNWHVDLLSRKLLSIKEEKEYQSAYDGWKTTWRPVFQEIGRSQAFCADLFTRYDEVLGLFFENQCAGLSLFNFADLRRSYWLEDSYFAPWPPSAIRHLTSHGFDVLICSFFTVTPRFRGIFDNISVKDALLGLLIRRFLHSDCDVMTGNLRNSKGINKLCYRWGATPLSLKVPFNGEENDLVAFFAESVNPYGIPELGQFLDLIWDDYLNKKKFFQRKIG